MRRSKSQRHVISARARWRAAAVKACAERSEGIEDRQRLTDAREPIEIDLRSYGGTLLRIEPRLGYISVRVTDTTSGEVVCCALKSALHRIADSLPRTMSERRIIDTAGLRP